MHCVGLYILYLDHFLLYLLYLDRFLLYILRMDDFLLYLFHRQIRNMGGNASKKSSTDNDSSETKEEKTKSKLAELLREAQTNVVRATELNAARPVGEPCLAYARQSLENARSLKILVAACMGDRMGAEAKSAVVYLIRVSEFGKVQWPQFGPSEIDQNAVAEIALQKAELNRLAVELESNKI